MLSEELEIMHVSSIYESEPVGTVQQPLFLNAVIKASTDFSAAKLLEFLQSVETRLGRIRDQVWGPRTIDIDILLYNGLILDQPDLIIPHPRLHQRAFVLVPLCEIDPSIRHPVLHKNVAQLLEENCQGQSVRLFGHLKHNSDESHG